jgi:hypothetical protein
MNAFECARRIPSVLATAIVLCALPRTSDAYCVRKSDVVLAWKLEFPDLRIPVYVAWDETNSVAYTGRSPEDVARIVLEVIARHNESVAAPKLYFAGFSDKVWGNKPRALTGRSMPALPS